MSIVSLLEGLKARQMIARGNAPGNRAETHQALKGRNIVSLNCIVGQICFALSGLDSYDDQDPRALPWAIICRPYRAGKGMVTA